MSATHSISMDKQHTKQKKKRGKIIKSGICGCEWDKIETVELQI